MTTVGVVGNRRYEGLPAILETLRHRAPELGLSLAFEPELHELSPESDRLDDLTPLDALLTLGGDGTMLRGARLLAGRPIPVLGVNLGHLGFLTSCGADEVEGALERLASRDYVVERRMTLEASCSGARARQHWRAVNDIVLHKGGFARVVLLRISVNGEPIGTYAADGIIVATPTGSTAYNLSAGGPIVVPTVESIIVTPISAHTLAVRPVVLPPTATVELQAQDGPSELLVTVDGQVGTTFGVGESLVVRRADQPVLMVRFTDASFFARMRRKLGWGGLWERDETSPC